MARCRSGNSGRNSNAVRFSENVARGRDDDSGETNLKTGISMPQFFERDGRYFVMYNINKEHILLDEIPARVLDELTPSDALHQLLSRKVR